MLIEHAWDRKFGEPLPTLEDVMAEADVMDKTIKYKDKDGNEKEATVGGILKKGEDHPAYDDAKKMVDKEKGGNDKEEPKGKALGKGDFERPGEEPSGEPEDASDGDSEADIATDVETAEEVWEDEDQPETKDLWDWHDILEKETEMTGGSNGLNAGDIKRAEDLIDAYDNTIDNDPEEAAKYLGKLKQLSSFRKSMDFRESIKVINGKKYRAIKESVEPKKHLLREMYERIGGK